jgi:hypothetical protein
MVKICKRNYKKNRFYIIIKIELNISIILEGPVLGNKYISSIIENAISDSFNNVLFIKVVPWINNAKCFSILAD